MNEHKYIGKFNVELNNKSSEWIKIDLPATFWYWSILYSPNIQYIKRIKSNTNEIIWRISSGRGEWLNYIYSDSNSDSNSNYNLENILYLPIKNKERENKIKKIIET